ncbi:hypothetical protein DXG03_004942 [Asterophora parasitica]|uniref:Ras GEF n=1 Tax=Asterophora parasitica TaxID=117018 RepID=A0A9P7GJB7_9AGAR|nr:hypothetical protein DXG03_004942 [Asterophora parasitica]
MSSKSLAAASGRTNLLAAASDPSRVASNHIPASSSSAPRPRKHAKKMQDDKTDTDSAYSDDAVPATSGVFVPSIPKFSLEESFPSILHSLKLIHANPSPDFAILHGLVQLFLTSMNSIVRSMDNLPHNIRLRNEYEVAQFKVIFPGSQLQAELSRQAEVKAPSSPSTALIIELVDLTVNHLRAFLKSAEAILNDSKPLPKPPSDSNDLITRLSTIEEQPELVESAPLINIVDVELLKILPAGVQDAPPSSIAEEAITDSKRTKLRTKAGSIIRNVVKRRPASVRSKISQFTQRSKSSVTLGDDPDSVTLVADETSSVAFSHQESFSCDMKERPEELPYVLRQSMIYYVADPYCPEIDIQMPLPTGDDIAVRLDAKGAMKAASLTALVRILVSKEAVLEPDFTPTFFISFRYFTTPLLFVRALIERYDAQPPTGLDAAQLRVWMRTQMAVHIRIGNAIILWLDAYWRPAEDEVALEELQNFCLHRLCRELPEGIVNRLFLSLDSVPDDTPVARTERKISDMKRIYAHFEIPPPALNVCSIEILPEIDMSSQLIALHEFDEGREEVARQLTIIASDLFCKIDPEDMIKYWHLKEDKLHAQEVDQWPVAKALKRVVEFERALASWVTHTVIHESDIGKRCTLLQFWLDVAARCLHHRNHSGAQCIISGVNSGAIARMKHTVLGVWEGSKAQFRRMHELFAGNLTEIREEYSSMEPAVPIIAPFNRDVITALRVVPTSVGSNDSDKATLMINLCSYRTITKVSRSLDCGLIPYPLDKHQPIQDWILSTIAGFPSANEDKLNVEFYALSKKLESKDEALHLIDPWRFTVNGDLNGKFTLKELAKDADFPRPKQRKLYRLAARVFRR